MSSTAWQQPDICSKNVNVSVT